jgi:hypothetical protein
MAVVLEVSSNGGRRTWFPAEKGVADCVIGEHSSARFTSLESVWLIAPSVVNFGLCHNAQN